VTVVRRSLLAIALLALLGSCGGATTAGGCPPDRIEPCPCANGRIGVAICGGACDCDPGFALVAEPASIEFGTVARGLGRDAVVLLRNPAPVAVAFRSVGIAGRDRDAFALPDGVPASVPAGGSVPLTVRMSAAASGTFEALLIVVREGADGPDLEVPISGRVSGAIVSCSPSPVTFPDTWRGATSGRSVVCVNDGDAAEGIDANFPLDPLVVEGEGFSARWEGARPGGLWPGQRVTVEVTFAPTAVGEHLGVLEIGGPLGQLPVPLAGTALETPECDLELPGPLHVAIDEPGASTTFSLAVRNRRPEAPCTLKHPRLCDGTDPAFSFSSGSPDDSYVLWGGESETFNVRFLPTYRSCHDPAAAGCFEFEVSPASDGRRSIPVTCEAPEYPLQYVYPDTLDFGEVTAGCEVVDRTVAVNNIGTEGIQLARIELNESTSDEFFLRSTPPAGTTIAPGTSATFTIAYRPEDFGVDTGSVFVFLEGQPEPWVVTLSGRGGGDVWVHEVASAWPEIARCLYLSRRPLDPNNDGTIDDGELHVQVDGTAVPSTVDGERVWWYSGDIVAVCFDERHLPEPEARIEVEYLVSGCEVSW
jgi:hypothetical protein